MLPHLLATALPVQAVDPKIEACGPTPDQSVLCSVVFRITDDENAAEVADRFTTPLRILVVLAVAYLVVRASRLLIARMVERLKSDDTQERGAKLRRRMGLAARHRFMQEFTREHMLRQTATVYRQICERTSAAHT